MDGVERVELCAVSGIESGTMQHLAGFLAGAFSRNLHLDLCLDLAPQRKQEITRAILGSHGKTMDYEHAYSAWPGCLYKRLGLPAAETAVWPHLASASQCHIYCDISSPKE